VEPGFASVSLRYAWPGKLQRHDTHI
jgi:hypothetical protein